ncbi:MAG: class I SAM-dependent methyltransferase [Candidatus Nanohaloarchaea archaeon]
MVEEPEEFYSSGAEKFDERHSIDNMPQEYIDLLDRFVELVDSGRVLDAGCGPGRDTDYFSRNGLEAVGVDLAEGMLGQTEDKRGEFHRMDVRDLEFSDGDFEGVWCNTVLHFFPRDEMEDVVSELSRVTQENGIIFVSFKLGDETIEREAFGSSVEQHLVPRAFALNLCQDQGEIIETAEGETPSGFKVFSVFFRNGGI